MVNLRKLKNYFDYTNPSPNLTDRREEGFDEAT